MSELVFSKLTHQLRIELLRQRENNELAQMYEELLPEILAREDNIFFVPQQVKKRLSSSIEMNFFVRWTAPAIALQILDTARMIKDVEGEIPILARLFVAGMDGKPNQYTGGEKEKNYLFSCVS